MATPASGVSIFIQSIYSLAFDCMWCGKRATPHSVNTANVRPVCVL